jgi:hypothetical protein
MKINLHFYVPVAQAWNEIEKVNNDIVLPIRLFSYGSSVYVI